MVERRFRLWDVVERRTRERTGHEKLTKTEREAGGGQRRCGRSGELFGGKEVEDGERRRASLRSKAKEEDDEEVGWD